LTLHVLFSPDSFLAFILGVILDFALEAVFVIPFELLPTPELLPLLCCGAPDFVFFNLFRNLVFLLFWKAAISSSSSSAYEWLFSLLAATGRVVLELASLWVSVATWYMSSNVMVF
jgi:hypothetical protein